VLAAQGKLSGEQKIAELILVSLGRLYYVSADCCFHNPYGLLIQMQDVESATNKNFSADARS
jgi:hypothetical protein